MLAPIALFTYNRYEETKKTIEYLKKSRLASQTDIFIFSDGAKNDEQIEQVQKIRNYLEKIDGFKTKTLIFSDENKGLATSIINGVTEIIEKCGKIIVLEDDLLVSEDFIEYMNQALDIYEDREDIWSISGFAPKIQIPSNYKEDVYLIRRGCSWGWATWKDRWDQNDWTMNDFEKLKKDSKTRKDFNMAGNDMFKMLELQKLGRIDSWAIRWCYSQYKLDKYTMYPTKSKISNIGFGDTATHGGVFIEKHLVELNNEKIKFNKDIGKNKDIILAFKGYNDLTLYGKIGYFLRKYNLCYKLIKNIIRKIIN